MTENSPNKESMINRGFRLLQQIDYIKWGIVTTTIVLGGLNSERYAFASSTNFRAGEMDRAIYYGFIGLVSFSGPPLLMLKDTLSFWINQNERERIKQRRRFT